MREATRLLPALAAAGFPGIKPASRAVYGSDRGCPRVGHSHASRHPLIGFGITRRRNATQAKLLSRLAAATAIILSIAASPVANAADPPDRVLIGTAIYQRLETSSVICSVPPTTNGPPALFHRSGTGNVTMSVPPISSETAQPVGGGGNQILQLIDGPITLIFNTPTSGSIRQLGSPNNSGEFGSDYYIYTSFCGYIQFYNPTT